MGSLPDTFWGKRHLTLAATDPTSAASKNTYICLYNKYLKF